MKIIFNVYPVYDYWGRRIGYEQMSKPKTKLKKKKKKQK